MKYLISLLITLAFLPSCKKESEPDPPIVPVDTLDVYVPIYQQRDTTMGAAYAKKLTANWKSDAICIVQNFFDTNYVEIILSTYASNGYQREVFGFGFIPKLKGEKQYDLKYMVSNTVEPNFVSPSYATLSSDGDVLEDAYVLDTTAIDNYCTITNLDLANKRIECTFTATFKIVEPRTNAANPKTVKFSEGRAWAVIQE